MIQFTEKLDVFAAAYVEAQKNVRRAAKDARNPHFKSTYADLASVDDACRDAFHEHDIAILQAPGLVADGKMHMSTVLIHKSGQRVEAELSVPLAKNDAQAYGSAVTYARRYALAAMTGVIAGEDDDGNAAVGNGHSRGNAAPAPRQERPAPKPAPAPVDTPTASLSVVNEMDEIALQFPGTSESFVLLVQQLRQCETTQAYKSWETKNLSVIGKLDTPEVNALRAECEAQKARIRSMNQLAA